jgi:glycosyltransferase involved in cell wall biosynthesis
MQGAHKFARLLRARLATMGYAITDWDSGRRCDICMVRGGLVDHGVRRFADTDDKLVVLFGGYDPLPDALRSLAGAIAMASMVIYNSRHGQDWVRARCCRPQCPEVVIHNGAEEGPLASLDRPVCLVACDNYDTGPKHRALEAAIAAMPGIRRHYPCAELWVLGDARPRQGIDRLLGYVESPDDLAGFRQQASVLMHLVENDHCPNTVLETLGQGIPVLCHASAGTREIVGWFGQAIHSIAPDDVAGAACSLLSLGKSWQDKWMHQFRTTLRIDAIAAAYDMALRKVLEDEHVPPVLVSLRRNLHREPR